MSLYIGIDLGGAEVAAGLVDDSCRVLEREQRTVALSRPVEELCEDLHGLCAVLTRRHGASLEDVGGIGVAAPGLVAEGAVREGGHPALVGMPLAAALHACTGKPVALQNNGNAAAFGEYVAGMTCHSLFVMTLGAAVDSGLILGGGIWQGFNYAAPEMGHIQLVPGGRPCPCGKRGCFAAYASAAGLVLSTREAMSAQPQSLLWKLALQAGDVSEHTVFEAARRGDRVAVQLLDTYMGQLAPGVAAVINLLQPEVFCLGGGLAAEGDGLMVPLARRVEELSFPGHGGWRTRLVLSRLGSDAAIVGAAMLARR